MRNAERTALSGKAHDRNQRQHSNRLQVADAREAEQFRKNGVPCPLEEPRQTDYAHGAEKQSEADHFCDKRDLIFHGV